MHQLIGTERHGPGLGPVAERAAADGGAEQVDLLVSFQPTDAGELEEASDGWAGKARASLGVVDDGDGGLCALVSA